MDYGILSLIPAILPILLATLTKNVIVSLAIAIFIGSTTLCGWNPMAGFVEVTHIFNALGEQAMCRYDFSNRLDYQHNHALGISARIDRADFRSSQNRNSKTWLYENTRKIISCKITKTPYV